MSVEQELEEQRKINRALLEENRAIKVQIDDHECWCEECAERDENDSRTPAEAVDVWLTRAKGLGQLSAAETAVVERLLEDLL